MDKTIFEKIAYKEIPSYTLDENDIYMAFLDINPSTYGQTLVIPKKQHDSYIFNNEDEFIKDFMIYVKKIAKILDGKLGSYRCMVVFEGLEVNHLHCKLFPLFKDTNEFNLKQTYRLEEVKANEIMDKLKS